MAERPAGPFGELIACFTRHQTAASLVLMIMVMLGVVSNPRLRAQFFLNVTFDSVIVTVACAGAWAEDFHGAAAQVLEQAVQNVEGVVATSAVSRVGMAQITLEFETGWSMDMAEDATKEAVDSGSGLPESS